jgi:phage gp45-like
MERTGEGLSLMGLDRDTLQQLKNLLRPLASRVANTAARAVVQLVNDATGLQLLQLGVLAGETIDDAEHHQPYGFASVPLAGAEAVVVFPNGDRSHPLVTAVSDRRYRPTGGEPGQITLYNQTTPRLILLPSGAVEIRSKDGTATKLPTLADYEALRAAFNAHVHATAGTGVPSPPTAVPSVIPVAVPAGTTVLKAE